MTPVAPRVIIAIASLLCAQQAQAKITPSMVPVPINSTLEANGWAGYCLVLTADAASNHSITVVELASDLMQVGGPMGIRGQLHQRWDIQFNNGALLPTPVSTLENLNDLPREERSDSMFLNQFYYSLATPTPFTEDNNFQNGSNPPHIRSPLADIAPDAGSASPGSNYGVGSSMTFTGATSAGRQVAQLFVALIIVPAGRSWVSGYQPGGDITIQGSALDPSSKDISTVFPIQFTYMIPEPASLSLLGLGALGLLARRPRAR